MIKNRISFDSKFSQLMIPVWQSLDVFSQEIFDAKFSHNLWIVIITAVQIRGRSWNQNDTFVVLHHPLTQQQLAGFSASVLLQSKRAVAEISSSNTQFTYAALTHEVSGAQRRLVLSSGAAARFSWGMTLNVDVSEKHPTQKRRWPSANPPQYLFNKTKIVSSFHSPTYDTMQSLRLESSGDNFFTLQSCKANLEFPV